MKLSISKAAHTLGVSVATLRRWDKAGKLKAERTLTGHRRYNFDQLKHLAIDGSTFEQTSGTTIAYARFHRTTKKKTSNGKRFC